MQGNDYVTSVMYRRGMTCFSCHDSHGTANDALLVKPARRRFDVPRTVIAERPEPVHELSRGEVD